MKYLLLVPQFSKSSVVNENSYLSQQTPFSSFPGTGEPECSLTNLNVLVSGQNVKQKNVNFSYEIF